MQTNTSSVSRLWRRLEWVLVLVATAALATPARAVGTW
jgi:hypothetical protein